ncbi:MAG TPA: hypothetical protein VGQ83_05775 [Polyangia bacterium]|jgi:hypothetical protein
MAFRRTVTVACLALALLLSPPGATAKGVDQADTGTISGRVVYRGRGIPKDRVVRVEVSQRFPLLSGTPDRSMVVDKKGEFTFKDLPAGTYWVVGYIDDDRDGHRGPGEICAFPRIAPMKVGRDHPHVRMSVELDPVHAILATRFRRTTGTARLELAFAALYARDPATGAPLPDAVATVEIDGHPRDLTWDPAFPGGAFVLYGDGAPAGERYVFFVSHPALGKARRRVPLHGRNFRFEPFFTAPTPIATPRGRELKVGWHQPAWANFATLEVFEPDPLGGLRRRWPESLGVVLATESPAVLPRDLLAGRRLHLHVVAGRADVRAENGEIWYFGAAGHEVQVGAPGTPLQLLKVAQPQAKEPPGPGPRPPVPASSPAPSGSAASRPAGAATGSRP